MTNGPQTVHQQDRQATPNQPQTINPFQVE